MCSSRGAKEGTKTRQRGFSFEMGESLMTNEEKKLKDLVSRARRIVFFGGAGVSTESGIPDFRSTGGLYHQQYDYPTETI